MTKLAEKPSTKQAIEQAAMRLFVAKGFNGVSMRDIAEAVGIRPSAIYNHFAAKHALLATLMGAHMDRVLAALTEALSNETGPENLLKRFVAFHISYHIDHPQDVFLAYMELRSLDPETHAQLSAQRDQYEAQLRDILRAGQADGTFQIADPAIHARAVLAMLTGVTQWYRPNGPLDRTSIIDSYMQAAMQSVGLRVS